MSNQRSREQATSARVARCEKELATMTSALIEANEQMLALHDLVTAGSGALEREPTIARVTEAVQRLLSAPAVVAMTVDGAAHVVAKDTKDTNDTDLADSLEALLTEAGEADDVRSRLIRDQPTGAGALVAPIRGSQSVHGTLAVAASNDRPANTNDLKVVETFAEYLAATLDIADLHEQAVSQALVERDYELASSLTQAALPSSAPLTRGLDVAAHTVPARSTGGDFFTYLAQEDGFWFAVGDVSGKGLPAAVVMSMATMASSSSFRREVDGEPATALQAVSDDLYDYLSDTSMFVTAVFGRYSSKEGTLRIANAGHSPVILHQLGESHPVGATAPPLGVLADLAVETQEFRFADGDILMIGSDGLAEQENPAGKMFGYGALQAVVGELGHLDADTAAKELLDLVEEFADGEPQADDRTVLIVRALTPGPNHGADTGADPSFDLDLRTDGS